MYALWLSKNFSEVFAFEPEDENFKILTMNIKLRRRKNIEVLKMAVSDNTGMGKLYVGEDLFGHSLKSDWCASAKFRNVKITSLNSFVKQPVDFVKVDVQGAAFDVVKGASEVMSKIKRWIIELEESELNRKLELETLMKSFGYDTLWLSEQHLYAFRAA